MILHLKTGHAPVARQVPQLQNAVVLEICAVAIEIMTFNMFPTCLSIMCRLHVILNYHIWKEGGEGGLRAPEQKVLTVYTEVLFRHPFSQRYVIGRGREG